MLMLMMMPISGTEQTPRQGELTNRRFLLFVLGYIIGKARSLGRLRSGSQAWVAGTGHQVPVVLSVPGCAVQAQVRDT